MTPDEEELFNELNGFRVNPKSFKDFVKTLKRGIKQLNPKDPMLPQYKNLSKELAIYEPVPAFQYSKELSEAAHDYLERCKKNPPAKKILIDNECNGIVPSSFMQGDSYTMVYFDDCYDDPKTGIAAMLAGKDDPEKNGKAYLISDQIKQIGIAVDKENDNSYVVLILDDDPVEPNDWKADFDDSELRLAFECLDYEGKNRLNIGKVLELVDEQGYGESNPTLTKMLAELKDKGKEFISYQEFAEHFNSRLEHEEGNEERDQEIFNVYLPDEKNIKSIDNAQLKQIRDYTNIDFDDAKIENMLRMNEHNKFGIDYEEYKDRVAKSGQ